MFLYKLVRLWLQTIMRNKSQSSNQREYVNEILNEFECKGFALMPLPSNGKFLSGQGTPLDLPKLYVKVVGKLNFLVHT